MLLVAHALDPTGVPLLLRQFLPVARHTLIRFSDDFAVSIERPLRLHVDFARIEQHLLRHIL